MLLPDNRAAAQDAQLHKGGGTYIAATRSTLNQSIALLNSAFFAANGLYKERRGRIIAKPTWTAINLFHPSAIHSLIVGHLPRLAHVPGVEVIQRCLRRNECNNSDLAPWREHLSGYLAILEEQNPGDDRPLKCPLVSLTQYEDAFKSTQEVKFHLQNLHCAEFVKASRKSRLADDLSAGPSKRKMTKNTFKQDHHVNNRAYRASVKPEEASKSKVSSSASSSHRAKSPSMVLSTAPVSPNLFNSRRSTLLTERADDKHVGETDISVAEPDEVCTIVDCDLIEEDPIDLDDGKSRALLLENSLDIVGSEAFAPVTNDSDLSDFSITKDTEYIKDTHDSMLAQILRGSQGIGAQPVALDAVEGIYPAEALLTKWKRGRRTWYLVNWKGFPHSYNTWQESKDIGLKLVQDFETTYEGNHLGVRLLKKRVRKRKVEYLVEWKGRPKSENSWENEATISRGRIMDFENTT
ncbi:hypothetical protein BKA64DRAFT_760093 [Cadophora sp. MPI-SDFR-AT-0126]|nr:hypothetical protein BKA64DRAFT_760093 [Leotiomycetes sp. MPI-SDFR-AT-0126]